MSKQSRLQTVLDSCQSILATEPLTEKQADDHAKVFKAMSDPVRAQLEPRGVHES